MKMNESNRIKLISIALVLLSIQLIGPSTANADSPRSWGYWNAGPAAGTGTTGSGGVDINSNNINTADNNNSGSKINDEQNVSRLSRTVSKKLTSKSMSDYIAYNICYYNCSGNNLTQISQTAGKIYIDLDQSSIPLSKPLVFGDSRGTVEFYSYNSKLSVRGSYNDNHIDFVDNGVVMRRLVTTISSTQDDSFFQSSGLVDIPLSPSVNHYIDGEDHYFLKSGQIFSSKGNGLYFIGKPIVASQIATQLSLGQTYQFSGRTYYGSNVNIAVNFQKANWNGNWDANKLHNGFTAGGNITSSTLASNQLKGIGSAGNGFVTGGKVNATLVGVINGTDASKAGVIGNAIVNVQQVTGTQTVGDIFAATAVAHP